MYFIQKYSYSQLPVNPIILYFIHFPLLVTMFTVEPPYVIGIISICTPIILIDVAGNGKIFYIFIILYNSIIGFLLWNTICGILVWVPTITISLETVTSLYMKLIVTLVTNNI